MSGRDLRTQPRRGFNSTAPAPTKPPNARNVERHGDEWIRVYGSPERVAWVNAQPCLVASSACAGKMENAHIKTGGISRKADAEFIVPLCRHHHRGELHVIGTASFEAKHGLSLEFHAARIHQQHLKECGASA
jgi:hypothetical protein